MKYLTYSNLLKYFAYNCIETISKKLENNRAVALFYLLAKTQRIQINTKIFIFTITPHDLQHTAYPQPPCKGAYSPEMVLTNSHKGREFHSSKGLSKEGRVMLFFCFYNTPYPSSCFS